MQTKLHFKREEMFKEAHDTKEAFGHDIPKNIEIEPFSHPYTSENNARLLRRIQRKHRLN